MVLSGCLIDSIGCLMVLIISGAFNAILATHPGPGIAAAIDLRPVLSPILVAALAAALPIAFPAAVPAILLIPLPANLEAPFKALPANLLPALAILPLT